MVSNRVRLETQPRRTLNCALLFSLSATVRHGIFRGKLAKQSTSPRLPDDLKDERWWWVLIWTRRRRRRRSNRRPEWEEKKGRPWHGTCRDAPWPFLPRQVLVSHVTPAAKAGAGASRRAFSVARRRAHSWSASLPAASPPLLTYLTTSLSTLASPLAMPSLTMHPKTDIDRLKTVFFIRLLH